MSANTFPAPIKHCSCFLKLLMPFTLSGTKPLPSNVLLISKLSDAVEAKEKREIYMYVLTKCKFSPKFKQVHKRAVKIGVQNLGK